MYDVFPQDMETCAVTTDGWVDPNRHVSYNCVTAHYVDSTFNLRSVVLATRIMARAHTGANIFEEVSAVLEEFLPDWEEEQRVAAFVTDNAANVRSAFRDSTAVWAWFGCACHNLNLAVKHALDFKELAKDSILKRLAAQIANTRALVTLVRRKGLDRHLDKSLKMEVETRWNSMLAMLSSVVEAIPQMTSSPAFQSADVAELVSGVNSMMLQRLVKLLTPLEEATNHLSGQEFPTLHLVAPTKEQLKRQLRVVATDDGTTRRLKERLSSTVDAKFAVTPHHLVAALLWPPHRQLDQFTLTTSEEERCQATSQLIELATELGECSTSSSAQQRTPPTSTEAGSSSSGSLAFFSFSSEDETASATKPQSAAAEVADYIKDPGPVGGYITKDILGYWSAAATRARFPVLCRVARRLLAVPAASTPSERAFSVSGRILEERRSSLHPDSVDSLVFLNSRGKAASQ